MIQTITLGGGCFWCVEAVFAEVNGVNKVESGYSGGTEATANYKAVCSKQTDHVEVVRVWFDDQKISLEDVLKIFFATHDPTQPNRQGNDVGPQYRSAVFYETDEQRTVAERLMQEFVPTVWDAPAVTELIAFEKFYRAENYHQDYYANTGDRNPYCTFVITPKVAKFRRMFADKLKKQVA